MAGRPHKQAYVAIGEGGLLKVGHTLNVRARLHGLKQEFKRKGDVLLRIHSCCLIEAAYSVESELITFCGDRFEAHSGREWFKAGDFDVVVEAAKQLTEKWRSHTYLTEAEMERFHRFAKKRREQLAAQRAANRAEYERNSRIRRLIRSSSERAIQAVVDFALGRTAVGA